jgi:hypothetical protein
LKIVENRNRQNQQRSIKLGWLKFVPQYRTRHCNLCILYIYIYIIEYITMFLYISHDLSMISPWHGVFMRPPKLRCFSPISPGVESRLGGSDPELRGQTCQSKKYDFVILGIGKIRTHKLILCMNHIQNRIS